ncbi:nucleotidyl transferase AbiEii/AbiGii toxin family protein [Streptomyces sp. NPDC093707]|uniref:nucleotidyl transferase AbiEii/AbiGii toxin family protein n=1 Tax=Streptomyces sp. NPDC093707 TaxID=3154984 RepID=UPI00344F2C7D
MPAGSGAAMSYVMGCPGPAFPVCESLPGTRLPRNPAVRSGRRHGGQRVHRRVRAPVDRTGAVTGRSGVPRIAFPVSGQGKEIELVAESLQRPPVATEWGPVLHRDDVAAGKMEALFLWAEVRDFIDVDALIQAGYSRERLIELAAQRDAGFGRAVLAQMLAGVGRFSDRQFLVHGVDQARVDGVRAQFEDWRQELQSPGADGARAAAARAPSPAANRARADSTAPSGPVPPAAGAPRREPPSNGPRRRWVCFAAGDHNRLRSLVWVNLLFWEVHRLGVQVEA